MTSPPQPTGSGSSDPVDFDALMDEFTSALRRGERPSIEDWAERHAEHADPIRELFPTIEAMETLKSSSTPAQPQLSFRPGDHLGDFEIVREIGRGGMGVVYEAIQSSLQRNIALKVLPALDDERRVQRFEREARTAAGLHHTNIVPIFGVGEHDGWHYYVMPIVRGASLDRVAARVGLEREGLGSDRPGSDPVSVAVRSMRAGVFPGISSSSAGASSDTAIDGEVETVRVIPAETVLPDLDSKTYWHSIAKIGMQVASALAYAHAAGVLHRDIKPANLLVDDDGVVWVTDFGLATAREVEGITRTGDVLGTVQYLAPEQLHGQADERSDLFGLGLTLYELCTGRPARGEGDRAELLRRAAEMRPERPSNLVPSIPRDLETILLKTIENEPRHRYQSAATLAEDLERFLEDRPIHARRVSVLESGARWCRRNKLVASLAALALIGVVGGGTTSVIGWIDARANAKRAETLLRQAYDGFDEVAAALCGIESIELGDESQSEGSSSESSSIEWRIQSLSSREERTARTLLAFYEELESDVTAVADPLTAARAARRLGDLHRLLWEFDEARASYGEALTRYESLAPEDVPDGDNPLVTGAVILGRLARVEFLAAFPESALQDRSNPFRRRSRTERKGDREQLERSSAVVERMRRLLETESGPRARFELGLAERFEALIDRELGDRRAALDHLVQAHTLFDRLSIARPDEIRYLSESVEAGLSWIRDERRNRSAEVISPVARVQFEGVLQATCDRVLARFATFDLDSDPARRLAWQASQLVMDLEVRRRRREVQSADVFGPWRAALEEKSEISRDRRLELENLWLGAEVNAVRELDGNQKAWEYFVERIGAVLDENQDPVRSDALRQLFRRMLGSGGRRFGNDSSERPGREPGAERPGGPGGPGPRRGR